MKTEKTWWMLEHLSGEGWLADADHETFTRDSNAALRWPNETRANDFRSRLPHPLWLKIKNGATEHKWVDLTSSPSPTPQIALTPLERAHRSLRALQEGAATALIALGEQADGTVGDFLAAIHREAVRGLLASDEITNEASPPSEELGAAGHDRTRDAPLLNTSEADEKR